MSLAGARTSAQRRQEDEHTNHDGEVRQVEYPGMKRADPDHHEVGDEPVANETVSKIAHASGPD